MSQLSNNNKSEAMVLLRGAGAGRRLSQGLQLCDAALKSGLIATLVINALHPDGSVHRHLPKRAAVALSFVLPQGQYPIPTWDSYTRCAAFRLHRRACIALKSTNSRGFLRSPCALFPASRKNFG